MKTIYKKLGNMFRMMMRLCYTMHGHICWNCGQDCGFDSIISHKLFWCSDCYQKWGNIKEPFKVSWKGIGKLYHGKDRHRKGKGDAYEIKIN